MRRLIVPRVLLFVILAFVTPPVLAASSFARTVHQVYFKHTSHELNVYKIIGEEPGKTLLLIGGIQGNEPGGYLAADLYVDIALRKGNMIVVPRANFYSIIKNQRSPHGDMNRKFTTERPRDYLDKIVAILKGLIAESDVLLNLHDGSGFFSETWEGPRRNPMRYGQSIIADAEVYYPRKKSRPLYLGKIARRIAAKVNRRIKDPSHFFRFNNHRTLRPDTLHPEQRKSATYFALTRYEIPAFGIETSKDIPSYRLRVKYQVMIINEFMREFGIIPENPRIFLEPPELRYLLISVNGGIPVALGHQETLEIQKGDSIEISHIQANYNRGLTSDIVGVGSENDLEKTFKIYKPTTIKVRKDHYLCGLVHLKVVSPKNRQVSRRLDAVNGRPELKYFVIRVNGKILLIKNRGFLQVIKGDRLRIEDLIMKRGSPAQVKVNFLGFVGNKKNNTGEDRGYVINTAKGLWVKYSLNKKGRKYRIVVTDNKKRIGHMTVELLPPRLEYLIIKRNGSEKICYFNGERIHAHRSDKIEILDIKTNVENNRGIKVKRIMDQKGFEILVTREGLELGKVRVDFI